MANHNRIPDQQRALVIGMAKAGTPPMAIARAPAVTVGIDAIYTILSKARAQGLGIPKFPPCRPKGDSRPGLVVRVALWREEQVSAIAAAARARGLTQSQLVNRLVAEAVKARLIDAVLDDGADDAA